MRPKTLTVLVLLAAGLFVRPATAHPVEALFEDNLNGTFTFAAMTINHGSAAVLGDVFLINGNSVAYDSESATTDAAWDARRAAATGYGPMGWSSVDLFTAELVLEVTVTMAQLTGWGVSVGNTFTIDTDSGSNLRWASGNVGTLTFATAGVPETSSTIALLGLVLAGLVGLKRRSV